MERRLSGSGPVILTGQPEIISLIEEIQARSTSISSFAGMIGDEVRRLVEVLEVLEHGNKAKQSFWDWLFAWVHKSLEIMASALGTAAMASTGPFPMAAAVMGIGSTFAHAASVFVAGTQGESTSRGIYSSDHKLNLPLHAGGKPERRFQALLELLRETIPVQAEEIYLRLANFQYCHQILQQEIGMMKGTKVRMNAEQADAARLQWSIHSAYLQMIPRSGHEL